MNTVTNIRTENGERIGECNGKKVRFTNCIPGGWWVDVASGDFIGQWEEK